MKIKFRKIDPAASAPMQGTPGSAGFDLSAVSCKWDDDLEIWEYSTGVAVEIPDGFVGLVLPRSSVCRTGAILSNCCGVIDSDYRGEITAKFYYYPNTAPYKVGERICQLVIVPTPKIEYIRADELSETVRGAGSYGSTGK